MKKSTIAAVAAAAMFGFGAVGSAMADTSISGFADINYDAFHSDWSEGTFRASGEVDITAGDDAAMVRIDLDLLNAHNSSPAADLPTGTDPVAGTGIGGTPGVGGAGADIEQLNVHLKLNDMAGLAAGIVNSPFGREGQDATDINFAANGLLWNYVPSNIAGALADVTLNDMISANIGYVNAWTEITGLVDQANDVVATVTATVTDGVSVTVGYLTDSRDGANGDMISAYVNLGLVENLDIAVDYLSADPGTTNANTFDNGYGVELGYTIGNYSVNGRYESASGTTTTPDMTSYSLAANAHMADNCVVRVDFTSTTMDNLGATPGNSSDTLTVQMVHSF